MGADWTETETNTDFHNQGQGNANLEPHEINRLRPFLYLVDGQDQPPQQGADQAQQANYYRRFVQHNTYPFSLPDDRVQGNTACFSNVPGSTPGDAAAVNSLVLPIIRNKVSHLIFEHFPDVTPLGRLGQFSSVDEDDPNVKDYGLHFFGNIFGNANGNLANVVDLLTQWSQRESLAKCDHLDFAISNLSGDERRRPILETIGAILDLQACDGLQTLSLRFMNLTNENFDFLAQRLVNRQRPNLRRLVFSFNGLDDNLLTREGSLDRLLSNTENLPNLSFIDFKGNRFARPNIWDIDDGIAKRSLHLMENRPSLNLNLVFALNGFAPDVLLNARASVLQGNANYDQPESFSPNDAQLIRDAFDGAVHNDGALTIIKKEWFLPNSPYGNLADQLTMLRYGSHRAWRKIDLTDRALGHHSDVELILRHIAAPDALRTIILKGAFGEGGGINAQQHEDIVKAFRRFNALGTLSLAQNSLEPIIGAYRGVLANIRTLREVDLSGNHVSEGSQTNVFLHGLILGLSSQREIRSLQLNDNIFSDGSFSSLLRSVGRSGQLAICDLSANRFSFNQPLREDLTNALLTQLENHTSLIHLNLTQNPIALDVVENIMTRYRQRIEANPQRERPWPILSINARNDDGAFTPVQEIGSARSFLRLAQVYEQSPGHAAEWEWASLVAQNFRKANGYYYEALHLQLNYHIDRFLGSTVYGHQISQVSAFNLAEANYQNPTANHEQEAEMLLRRHGLPITPELKSSRAKLLANRDTLLANANQQPLQKIQYFKTLPAQEQRYLVFEVLTNPHANVREDHSVAQMVFNLNDLR